MQVARSVFFIIVLLGIAGALAYFLDGFHQHSKDVRELRIQKEQDSIKSLVPDTIQLIKPDSLDH